MVSRFDPRRRPLPTLAKTTDQHAVVTLTRAQYACDSAGLTCKTGFEPARGPARDHSRLENGEWVVLASVVSTTPAKKTEGSEIPTNRLNSSEPSIY